MTSNTSKPYSTAYVVDSPVAAFPATTRTVVGAIPPAFADLNKPIKDLFTKNYHIGFGKVDVLTKIDSRLRQTVTNISQLIVKISADGMEVRGILQQDIGGDAPRAFGSLEHKYVQKDYGLTLIEKWSTDNMITTEASVEDTLLLGAKLTLLAGLSAHTGKRNAALKFAYRRPFLHLTTDVDLDFAGPIIRSSAVSAYDNFRFGGSMVFDSAKSAITRYNLALGLGGANRYTLHAGTTLFRDFEMGVHYRVQPNLEVGFQSNFSSSGGNSLLALGTKYDVDQGLSFKAKVDTVGQVGLSHTQELRRGVRLTISALINGLNVMGGGHRYGLGLEIDL